MGKIILMLIRSYMLHRTDLDIHQPWTLLGIKKTFCFNCYIRLVYDSQLWMHSDTSPCGLLRQTHTEFSFDEVKCRQRPEVVQHVFLSPVFVDCILERLHG